MTLFVNFDLDCSNCMPFNGIFLLWELNKWTNGAHSPEFVDYVSQRGYVLKTVKEYARLLSQAGFGDVDVDVDVVVFGGKKYTHRIL